MLPPLKKTPKKLHQLLTTLGSTIPQLRYQLPYKKPPTSTLLLLVLKRKPSKATPQRNSLTTNQLQTTSRASARNRGEQLQSN